MSQEQWKSLTEKVIGHLPDETKDHQWQKYPDLLENRLQDALVRGPESVDEWVAFFDAVFGYKLNPLEVSIGIKPPYPCASIVVPKYDMTIEKYRRDNPHHKYGPTEPAEENAKTEIYKICMDVFPYTRYTPKPIRDWRNYFGVIDDCCNRPPKPYLIWVKIPDFDWKEERKLTWEQRWDSPGTTFLEQMLLDLFWWNKYKVPFGKNFEDSWKTGTSHGNFGFLCSGSEFREGRWPDEKYHKEFCGHKRLIPATCWGLGGWYVGSFGYKSATTPSPVPCVVTY